MNKYEYIVDKNSCRLDSYLASQNDNLSRSAIQKLIAEGNVFVNDKNEKANYKLKLDDKISLTIPEPKTMTIEAENIPLDILYEDEDIIDFLSDSKNFKDIPNFTSAVLYWECSEICVNLVVLHIHKD